MYNNCLLFIRTVYNTRCVYDERRSHKESSRVGQELVEAQHQLAKLQNEHQVYVATSEPQVDKSKLVDPLKDELSQLRKQLEDADLKLAKVN